MSIVYVKKMHLNYDQEINFDLNIKVVRCQYDENNNKMENPTNLKAVKLTK